MQLYVFKLEVEESPPKIQTITQADLYLKVTTGNFLVFMKQIREFSEDYEFTVAANKTLTL